MLKKLLGSLILITSIIPSSSLLAERLKFSANQEPYVISYKTQFIGESLNEPCPKKSKRHFLDFFLPECKPAYPTGCFIKKGENDYSFVASVADLRLPDIREYEAAIFEVLEACKGNSSNYYTLPSLNYTDLQTELINYGPICDAVFKSNRQNNKVVDLLNSYNYFNGAMGVFSALKASKVIGSIRALVEITDAVTPGPEDLVGISDEKEKKILQTIARYHVIAQLHALRARFVNSPDFPLQYTISVERQGLLWNSKVSPESNIQELEGSPQFKMEDGTYLISAQYWARAYPSFYLSNARWKSPESDYYVVRIPEDAEGNLCRR